MISHVVHRNTPGIAAAGEESTRDCCANIRLSELLAQDRRRALYSNDAHLTPFCDFVLMIR